MKLYFVKYLSVEGEIREGNEVFNKEIQSTVVTVSAIVGESVWFQETPGEYNLIDCILAKLSLCSRDIKVGDRFDSANGTGFICSGLDSNWIYSIGGLQSDVEEVSHRKEWAYKKIDEIPAEATWVREGDEFKEDEIRIVKIPWGRFHTKGKIQIKGPCGHFH